MSRRNARQQRPTQRLIRPGHDSQQHRTDRERVHPAPQDHICGYPPALAYVSFPAVDASYQAGLLQLRHDHRFSNGHGPGLRSKPQRCAKS